MDRGRPAERLLKGFRHSKLIASRDLDLSRDTCERCLAIREAMLSNLS
jgi:hypothetical protein